MKVFYSSQYYADIGEGHVFPIRKFELVRDKLLREGTLSQKNFAEPQPASISDALLVHTEDYITRLRAGALTPREIRRLGLPWTKGLVRRSFRAVGGTIAASQYALQHGIGSNLAGGTHHSFPDRGEGFCVLNDVAIAIHVLRRKGSAQRFGIVDLDVHQGNGTAEIFQNDDDVFTFSMHGVKNYPLFKIPSKLDVELNDGTSDDEYLNTLANYLPRVFDHKPDMIFYLGGADPYEKDKLGRLSLTMDGLQKRDEFVLVQSKERNIPIVTTMSGGYAENINDTVEIHCNTIRTVKKVFYST